MEDTTKKVEDNTTAISVNTNILYDVLKRLKAGASNMDELLQRVLQQLGKTPEEFNQDVE
ncbi:hypothetical protein [Peribacillus asahii]|uniref:hypothetical protein n=1 Tax=Peribacillus asahii TaxID=228899 RepID=UPI003824582A